MIKFTILYEMEISFSFSTKVMHVSKESEILREGLTVELTLTSFYVHLHMYNEGVCVRQV